MSFVAKRELAQSRPLRWLLSRMGARFVERDDVRGSVADARVLLEAVQGGQVHVDAPLHAPTADWHGALQLRDAARQRIAASCGEPVLQA
ncbi:MAG: hypothetical protein ACSLE9_20885 [Burkholderiaceae bacterium]|jgi:1-acyl-sn-glycerol-3-phosphate acyltransferase